MWISVLVHEFLTSPKEYHHEIRFYSDLLISPNTYTPGTVFLMFCRDCRTLTVAAGGS